MVGWLVFLGVYQIFLAWKFGTFFEGSKGDLRHYFGGAAMEPLYAAIGVTALIVAWGGWRLRAAPGLGGAAGRPMPGRRLRASHNAKWHPWAGYGRRRPLTVSSQERASAGQGGQ
jgi:hypothetical protein